MSINSIAHAIPEEAMELLHEGAFGKRKADMQAELRAAGTDFATVSGIVRSNFELYRNQPEKLSAQMDADLAELIGNEHLRTRALLFCTVERGLQNIYHMLEGIKIMDNPVGRKIAGPELRKAHHDVETARRPLIDYVAALAEESKTLAAHRIDSVLGEMKLSLGIAGEIQR